MVQLSTKLRIMSLVLALTIISLGDSYGADWKLLTKSKMFLLYYDKQSITYPLNDVVRVWVATYPSEDMINSIEEKYGEKYGALSYWYELVEIHCRHRRTRVISQECYSSGGADIGSFYRDLPTRWGNIRPSDIRATQILEGLCK
jgi:hypothetical protein